MRFVALLVAVSFMVVGVVGLVSPESGTAVRRLYFATPAGLYSAAALRVAMGLVLILVARASRAPKTLRVMGAIVCLQGLAATFFGPARARAILEWEATQATALLRVGAALAIASGAFVIFAMTGRRPDGGAE